MLFPKPANLPAFFNNQPTGHFSPYLYVVYTAFGEETAQIGIADDSGFPPAGGQDAWRWGRCHGSRGRQGAAQEPLSVRRFLCERAQHQSVAKKIRKIMSTLLVALTTKSSVLSIAKLKGTWVGWEHVGEVRGEYQQLSSEQSLKPVL